MINDFKNEDMVTKVRRTRHQRDANLGRLVRVPRRILGLGNGPDIVCAIICWVPEDHYMVAVSSDVFECTGQTSTIVPAGVCVDV